MLRPELKLPKLSIFLNDEAYEALESLKRDNEKVSAAIARVLIEAEARKLIEELKAR